MKDKPEQIEEFTLVYGPTMHQQILLDACKKYLQENTYKAWSRFDGVAKNIIAFIEKNQYADNPVLSDAIAASVLVELNNMLAKEKSTLFQSLIAKHIPTAIAASFPPKVSKVEGVLNGHFDIKKYHAHDIALFLLQKDNLTTQQIDSLLKNVDLKEFNTGRDYPPEEELVVKSMLKTRNWPFIDQYLQTVAKPSLGKNSLQNSMVNPLVEILKRCDYDQQVLIEIVDYLKNDPQKLLNFTEDLLGVYKVGDGMYETKSHLPPALVKHKEFYSELVKMDLGKKEPLYEDIIQKSVKEIKAEMLHQARGKYGLLAPADNVLPSELKSHIQNFIKQSIEKDLNEPNTLPPLKK